MGVVKRRALFRAVVLLVAVVAIGWMLLTGPVAGWLQGGEIGATTADRLDALYLVAGARDQNRRIRVLVQYMKECEVRGADMPVTILLANDRAVRFEVADFYPGVRMAELAEAKIPLLLEVVMGDAADDVEIVIVPGCFKGTDGEMEALAAYLEERTDIRRLGIVTSAYHMRRAAWRLHVHLRTDVTVRAIRLGQTPEDRRPLLVLSELAKMARAACGLSRAPLLSRH